jgi:hypothetical protein
MVKKIVSSLGLLIFMLLLTGILTAAAPVPNVTFTLLSGLPATMNVGDTATVVVQVTSDQEFNFAQVLPTAFFPGRGVVAENVGGDRELRDTTATLEVTFRAKGSTAGFEASGVCPGSGVAPVAVVAGVRYQGGFVASQRFSFCVTVP